MPYSLLITRSFSIAWHHRYLWLLAFLAGETVIGTGGAGGQFSGRRQPSSRGLDALNHLAAPNLGVVVTAALILAGLLIVFFLVSCVAGPALIRSAAEHDAERDWSHGAAWRAGWQRFGPVLRLKLLMLLYAVVLGIVFGAIGVMAVVAFVNHQPGQGVILILLMLALALALIPISIAIGIAYTLGMRVITLELTGAVGGFRRGFGILRRLPGRVLGIWLLAVGIRVVAGTVVGVVLLLLLSSPISIGAEAVFDGDLSTAAIAFGAVALISLAAGGIAGGAAGAYVSTYWTLAYRRLDW